MKLNLLNLHLRNWLFTESAYQQIRDKNFQNLQRLINKAKQSISSQQDFQFPVFQIQDTETLIQGYCQLLLGKEKTIFNNSQVQTTAIGLFQRFYLKKNIHEVNPINILKTVIIIAAKIEEISFSPDVIVKELNLQQDKFIKYERQVLEQIEFNLHFLNVSQVAVYFLGFISSAANSKETLKYLNVILASKAYFIFNPILLTICVAFFHNDPKTQADQIVSFMFKNFEQEIHEKQIAEILIFLDQYNFKEILMSSKEVIKKYQQLEHIKRQLEIRHQNIQENPQALNQAFSQQQNNPQNLSKQIQYNFNLNIGQEINFGALLFDLEFFNIIMEKTASSSKSKKTQKDSKKHCKKVLNEKIEENTQQKEIQTENLEEDFSAKKCSTQFLEEQVQENECKKNECKETGIKCVQNETIEEEIKIDTKEKKIEQEEKIEKENEDQKRVQSSQNVKNEQILSESELKQKNNSQEHQNLEQEEKVSKKLEQIQTEEIDSQTQQIPTEKIDDEKTKTKEKLCQKEENACEPKEQTDIAQQTEQITHTEYIDNIEQQQSIPCVQEEPFLQQKSKEKIFISECKKIKDTSEIVLESLKKVE